MFIGVYVTTVVQHFLGAWLDCLYLTKESITYPEVLHCLLMRCICGSDEVVVIHIGRFR